MCECLVARRFELLGRPRARAGGLLQKDLPALGTPHQDPERAFVREARQVTSQGLLERSRVERVRQCLAERHQAFQFGGPQPCEYDFRRNGRGVRFLVLALPRFVKDEHPDEDRQRRQQVNVIAVLDDQRRVPDEAQRSLKDDDGAGDEADHERGVVLAD